MDQPHHQSFGQWPKPRTKSEFAAFIATTYFIPGITGRARCLQDCALKPDMHCNHKHENPPTSLRTIQRQRSASNFNTWEIDGPTQQLFVRQQSFFTWTQTPSYLTKQPQEDHVEKGSMVKGSCNHSISSASLRTVITESPTRSYCSVVTSTSQPEYCDPLKQLRVACSRPFPSVRDRWSEYRNHANGCSRRCALQEELLSIGSLLKKQRQRVRLHESPGRNSSTLASLDSRPPFPTRSNSSMSCLCDERKHKVSTITNTPKPRQSADADGMKSNVPTRTLSTRSFGQHENERRCSVSNSYIDRPPLVVTIHNPHLHRKQLAGAPSA